MSARRVAVALALLGFGLPLAVQAQGLGQAAAREKTKRAKEPARAAGQGRTYSNEDLEAGRPAGETKGQTGTDTATASPESAETGPSATAPIDDRNTQEKPYLDAITAAQNHLNDVQERIRSLQNKLNPMSTEFIYGTFQGGDAIAEEARVKEELNQLTPELEGARQGLIDAQRALDDVRAGRPPSSTRQRD